MSARETRRRLANKRERMAVFCIWPVLSGGWKILRRQQDSNLTSGGWKKLRRQQDSNLRGQSPIDFE
uniref:Uncharacterized protein n=1 Tax=Caenorhabditis japonica TaxID=281687 RepID=A0A8R1ENA5_CAEJA